MLGLRFYETLCTWFFHMTKNHNCPKASPGLPRETERFQHFFIAQKSVSVLTTGHKKDMFTVTGCLSRRRIKAPTVYCLQTKDTSKEHELSGRGSCQVSGEGVDGPRTGAGLAEGRLRQCWWSDQKKYMLVWDSFQAHLSPPICNTLKSLNKESTVTSMLHPLDVTVNKPFKDCMRKKWQEWMLAGQNTFTTSGHISEGGTGSDLLVDPKA